MFEYGKGLEVTGEYDVAVAGAGPAGICAAIAAARQGMSVLLIERYGALAEVIPSPCPMAESMPIFARNANKTVFCLRMFQ